MDTHISICEGIADIHNENRNQGFKNVIVGHKFLLLNEFLHLQK